MTLQSIGDLASHFVMRRLIVQTKQTASALSVEATTGRAADVTQRTKGDLSTISSIERRLTLLGAQDSNLKIAQTRAVGTQTALGQMEDALSDIRAAMVVTDGNDQTARQALYQKANGAMTDFLSALNSSSAGRGLFSGAAGTAAIDPERMNFDAIIDPSMSADEVIGALDEWFNDTENGYSAAYSGTQSAAANSGLKPPTILATDPAFRTSLASLAIVQIANDPNAQISESTRRSLMAASLQRLSENEGDITTLRASVGSHEERLDTLLTRNANEAAGLNQSLQSVLGVDQAEAAVNLQHSQTQLEMLYSITARLSKLSLSDYLR